MVNGTVVSILRGGFTTVERTLIDTGEIDSVYRMRRCFQQAMETSSGRSSRRRPVAT
jgi:hypothetical protein